MLLRYWMVSGLAVFAGAVLDWLIGDPLGGYHPICLIGRLVSCLEGMLLKTSDSALVKRRRGVLLVLLVLVLAAAAAGLLGILAYRVNVLLGFAYEAFLAAFMLSARSLYRAGMRVYSAYARGDVEAAREAVSMVVGRDVDRLSGEGIIRAAVETVAENTSDGLTAPLFYMLLLGPVGGVLYKSVNTMDSMAGYKNEKYIDFGRCAAKTDDVFNYIPSRLTGLLMVAAAYICGLDGANAWRIFRRDRLAHSSPNSAHTESACAGALGVRLAGDAWYGGVLHEKPYIGDSSRNVECDDIRRACRLMLVTYLLALLLGVVFRTVIACMVVGWVQC
jgi:adenosylcobinamide-phosphate synthase